MYRTVNLGKSVHAVSLLAAIVLAGVWPAVLTAGTAVLQVDHLVVLTEDETARNDLFRLLTETLQLPVAGPNEPWSEGPDKPDLGIIGTVSLGSVQLELTSIRQPSIMYFNTGHADSDTFSIFGLVLRPEIPYSDAVKLVESIGLYGVPHYQLEVVAIDELSSESLIVAVMKPSDAWGPYSVELETELRRREGGPLGLIGVKEVIVGSPAEQRDNTFWREFADCDENYVCRMFADPAIVLKPSEDYGVQSLVLRVRSLDRAKEFLKSRELMGEVTKESVDLSPRKVNGLKITLVE